MIQVEDIRRWVDFFVHSKVITRTKADKFMKEISRDGVEVEMVDLKAHLVPSGGNKKVRVKIK